MSYTIVHDKVVLKAKDQYIFAVLYSDSNVWSGVGRRRSRPKQWSIWAIGDAEKIQKHFAKMEGDEIFQQSNGTWMTAAKLRRWVLNAMNCAMTAEEYSMYTWSSICLQIGTEAAYCRTTEALAEWISQYQSLHSREKKTAALSLSESLPKIPKISGKVFIKFGSQVVTEIEDSSFTTNTDKKKAKIFDSVEEAKTEIGKCNHSFATAKKRFTVRSYENYESDKRCRRYVVILDDEALAEVAYYKGRVKGYIAVTPDIESAQKFTISKAAELTDEINREGKKYTAALFEITKETL